jgi:hypothetical protein
MSPKYMNNFPDVLAAEGGGLGGASTVDGARAVEEGVAVAIDEVDGVPPLESRAIPMTEVG